MSSNTNPDSINVYCTITAKNGERVPLELSTSSTARQVRELVSKATKIPLDQLRLIFRGKMIKDDNDNSSAVATYKLEPDCVVHCMGKPVEDDSMEASSSTSTDAIPASTLSGSTTAAAIPSISTTTATVPAAAGLGLGATASAGAAAAVTTPRVLDPLTRALQTLRTSNPPAIYHTAVSTLAKILGNIVAHPLEEKYRQVKKMNVAFQKKLGGLPGGDEAMHAVGFRVIVAANNNNDDNNNNNNTSTTENRSNGALEVYQMQASPEAWNQLLAHKATMDAAVLEAQRSLNTPRVAASTAPNSTNPFPAMGGGVTGLGAANPFLGPGMMMPGASMDNPLMMQSAMAEMMSNPEAIRSMLQNPMVQQMIQNDPNVSPMIRNSMQQLANNPAMLNQLTQMMSDPAMRARMQQSMMSMGADPSGMMPPGVGAGGMGGWGGSAMPPVPSNANQINNNYNNSNSYANNNNTTSANALGGVNSRSSGGGNDQDQTEEEMIAEAIRRSLEES